MPLRSILLALPFALAATLAAEPVNEHGVQRVNMDASVRPGDDFNLYANGGWMKTAVIPPDQAAWGSFSTLRDKAAERTAALIEDLAKTNAARGSNERKIDDFYASYMDEDAIAAKGLAPLRRTYEAIAAITDKAKLARALGRSVRADVDALNNTNFYTENLFGLWVAPAFDDPGHYDAYLLQGGLGLPDRSYYLASGNDKFLAAYEIHVANVLALAGFADAADRAKAVVALEVAIAQSHVSRADDEEVLKANNRWTPAAGESSIFVWQPSAAAGAAAAAANTPLAVWKDYLTFHLLNHFSPVLPKPFDDERFAFYGVTMTGTPAPPPRWKRAVAAANAALGWAVGKLYAARYFPPAYKAQAQGMVDKIKDAFARRIDALDWMSAAT